MEGVRKHTANLGQCGAIPNTSKLVNTIIFTATIGVPPPTAKFADSAQ